jgi:hypothetical protein
MIPVLGLSQEGKETSSPDDCVTSFFKAFHAQDTVKMKYFIHDDITLATIKSNVEDTVLVVEDIHQFYKSIASIPETLEFREELTEIEVMTDGLIAHVWTEYIFYVNDELSHKGVNAFTLLRADDSWKIIYLVDTRRKGE